MRSSMRILLVLALLLAALLPQASLQAEETRQPACSGGVCRVNTTSDGSDATPGDGICEMSAGLNDCSLRAAIEESNSATAISVILLNHSSSYGVGDNDLDILDDVVVCTEYPTIPNVCNTSTSQRATLSGELGDERIFDVLGNSTLTLVGLELTLATAKSSGSTYEGGAIRVEDGELILNNGYVYLNSANHGGGIYVASGSRAIILRSIIGINGADLGGGIYSAGRMELKDVAVLSNSAINDSSPTSAFGGGIYLIGYLDTAEVDLTNVTLSGNTAQGKGGAIALAWPNQTLSLWNCTISENEAEEGGGGVYGSTPMSPLASFSISNTIIAGNSDSITRSIASTPDCEAELTSYQYNIIGDMGTDCSLLNSTSDQVNTDPLLMPLGDNGGGHSTYDLASFSPAFDGGNPTICLWDDDNDDATPPVLLSWDARGYSRPANGRCDVGAIEHRLFNNGFEGGTTNFWSDVNP